MWMLLSLIGGVAALSATDMFTPEDDPDDPDGTRREDGMDEPDRAGRGDDHPPASGAPANLLDYDDADPDRDADTRPDAPVLGRFDALGERIHSSDAYPDPAAPSAVRYDGGAGADVWGGTGLDDTAHGLAGDDTLAGHGGSDLLDGGAGDDSLVGGAGADTLAAGPGNDTLVGGNGADVLLGHGGANTFMAGDGADTLVGAPGASFLNGGAGDDMLRGSAGNQLHGGAGADTFQLGTAANGFGSVPHIIDYTAGVDELQISYDPATGTPELVIGRDDQDPRLAQVFLDGELVATVANADRFGLDDIVLVADGRA